MDMSGQLTAQRVAADIAAGRTSSRDVLEAFLGRCAESMLNAVVTIDADAARAEADARDRVVADGQPLGPLHGVPMTVKDAWAVRGMRSTSGTADLADDVPDYDAPAVARLRAAGAVIFGRTNVPPEITGQETANSLFGRTVNPWDPARTPGGSSGGAAAAVAAGLSPLELGSDSGGSIRQPAHCCGIYGHVPTHGLVPLRGHRPQSPYEEVGKDIDLMTAGPLAGTAADLELALSILVGDDPVLGPGGAVLPGPAIEHLQGTRVAVWFDDPACPVESQVGDRFDRATDALAGAGARIVEWRPDFTLAQLWDVGFRLWVASSSARSSDEEIARLRGERREPGIRGMRAEAATMSHRDWLRLDECRRRLVRRWAEALDDVDVLLCPVIPTTAPTHDPSEDLDVVASVDHRIERTLMVDGTPRPYLDQLVWNVATGLAGLPSTVAPAGIAADNLPVGMQIVAAAHHDLTTIRFAGLLSDVLAPPTLFAAS
jgi:amidase